MTHTARPLIADPCIVLGRKGNIGQTHLFETPCWPIDTVFYVHPPVGVDIRFLNYSFETVDFASLNRSTTTPSLRRQDLEAIAVPVPPLPEQHRIVEVLEDHLSRLDAAERSLSDAATKIAAYARSAITMRDADGEKQTAATRLNQILKVRAGSVSRRRQTATPPAYQLDLPRGWETVSVDQLSWDIQYGTSSKTGTAKHVKDIPVLRMGNIRDGRITPTELKYLPCNDTSIEGLMLEPGDLLFNRTNSAELVGKAAVFHDELPDATFASYLIRCRPVPGVRSDWISHIVNGPIGRGYVRAAMSQQVGQANVNGTKLAAMPIPLAPIATEERLLEELAHSRTTSQRLKSEIVAATLRSSGLRRSLLRAAFNGELVDQDPSDEPADVALAKLRAEKPSKTVRRRSQSAAR